MRWQGGGVPPRGLRALSICPCTVATADTKPQGFARLGIYKAPQAWQEEKRRHTLGREDTLATGPREPLTWHHDVLLSVLISKREPQVSLTPQAQSEDCQKRVWTQGLCLTCGMLSEMRVAILRMVTLKRHHEKDKTKHLPGSHRVSPWCPLSGQDSAVHICPMLEGWVQSPGTSLWVSKTMLLCQGSVQPACQCRRE